MKKLLLLLLSLSPLISIAAVDESKTDLYYANGMGIELGELKAEEGGEEFSFIFKVPLINPLFMSGGSNLDLT